MIAALHWHTKMNTVAKYKLIRKITNWGILPSAPYFPTFIDRYPKLLFNNWYYQNKLWIKKKLRMNMLIPGGNTTEQIYVASSCSSFSEWVMKNRCLLRKLSNSVGKACLKTNYDSLRHCIVIYCILVWNNLLHAYLLFKLQNIFEMSTLYKW